MTKLKIYKCRRSDLDYEGALIICADSEEHAIEYFQQQHTYPPETIHELPIIPGVMYDDYIR
jgi:hypothetical protein